MRKLVPGSRGSDAAAVLLRLAIGGTMIAHGVKHGRSLAGTGRWFESIGFRQPALQARASAAVEIGSGALLVAGAATPLASAAVIGTMGVAARTVHAPNGFFITSEGWEYVANLAVGAVALSAIGPGRWSVDRLAGADGVFSGRRAALGVSCLGVLASAAQLALFWRQVREPAVG